MESRNIYCVTVRIRLEISLSMALNSFRKPDSHATGQEISPILEDPILVLGGFS
jgi:hypothetical protein